jgi:dATP pyrophosphohydrolase
MPVLLVRPAAIAVYVYRRSADGAAFEFLQMRRSPRSGRHPGLWQPVYGGVEPDPRGIDGQETAVMAALRELREETGLTPLRMFQVEYIEQFYLRVTDSLYAMPVFAVEIDRSAQITLNDEHVDVRWIPEHDINSAFLWRSQREALSVLLAQLHHPTAAADLLEIRHPERPSS